ncbi:hypothetical protein QQS21_004608 [Conoideocrella luteorostrata]|uniref:Uncharacterized protein n=1 Tax=Conoideocrella luteorostrata TaxID=1105319 RepID=A0AAJ0CR01_9HYPO|nr:hypothetical protein QQS21_004608 [Conoideocrella luteorostrata]
MVAITAVLLLITPLFATAAPTISQNYVERCYNDITNIDNNVRKLTKEVQAYRGGVLSAAPQILLAGKAIVATASGGHDSSLLPQTLSLDDLSHLADHVNKTLAVDNPIAVETVVAKKNLYFQAGLRGPLYFILKELLKLHLRFSYNVLDRVPSDAPKDLVRIAMADIDAITVALQKGVAAFQ